MDFVEESDDVNKCRLVFHKLADPLRLNRIPILRACLAEFVGTMILVIIGCGVMAQVNLGLRDKGPEPTFISISLGWGMAITFGIFFAGCAGSGHINPAITLAQAVVGKISFWRVPVYTLSQLAGAFLGAMVIYGVYFDRIHTYANEYDHGEMLINTTGTIFVTNSYASPVTCFFDQFLGTVLFSAGILAITDSNGWQMPNHMQPLHIGLLFQCLVASLALNAGCALNPARDLGPRLALLALDYGTAAFTTGNYFFWIPIAGPYAGAVVGAIIYELAIGIHLNNAGDSRFPF